MNNIRKHTSMLGFIKSAYGQPMNAYGSQGVVPQQQGGGMLSNVGNFAVNAIGTGLAVGEPIHYARQLNQHVPNIYNAARGVAPPAAPPVAANTGNLARLGSVASKGMPVLTAGMSAYGAYSANKNMVNTAESLGKGDQGWDNYKQTKAYERDRGSRDSNLGILGATGVGAAIGSVVPGVGTAAGAAVGTAIGAGAQLIGGAKNYISDKFTGYNRDAEMQGVQNAMGATSGQDMLSYGMRQYNNPNATKQKGWFGRSTDNSLTGKNILATDVDKQLKANAK